jgi:hypothetical protein
MPDGDKTQGAGVAAFVAAAERDLANPAEAALSDDDIERVMTAAVKLYAARTEATETYPKPITPDKVTATEAVVAVCEMIRAVDLNLFDLSMWYRRVR